MSVAGKNEATGFEGDRLHLSRVQEIHTILIEGDVKLLDALILLRVD
jgi:hypothetical protein